ncbi:glycosyltransferase family 4 protein [soil metagenome]
MSGRVLSFFIQDLREGGAERNVARLLSGIVARDIPTDLIVVKRSGKFFSELDPRVNVVELPQQRTLTSVMGLKRYIETRRPLALVSSLTHTNVAAVLANMVARPRTRLIVVERNQYAMNRALKHGLVRLSYGLVPWAYRRADLIGAVSAGIRDEIADVVGIPHSRVALLHNPVVTASLARSMAAPVDHPWLTDGGPPVVLGVGRFTRQKNFALLLKAVAEVCRQRPLRLILLGDGELRDELEKLAVALGIAAAVDFPGFDANPFRFMARAALYVMSSDWEGLPTALIEAMACGCPVVATDTAGGPREILDNGRLGRIVPKDDVAALARAIAATLDAPGDAAGRFARAGEFNLDRAVDRYLAVAGWS